MYYLPTSCLVLLSLSALFHHISSASSKQEPGWCKSLFQCGNITAGFPFSGENRPQVCGLPSLGLRCFNNITSIIISDHFYNVLHIDQTYNTLRLSRAELEGSFCNAAFTTTTLPSEIFELLPAYKSLTVSYLCDPNTSYRSSYTCPNRGPVFVSQNLDYHRSCQDSFKINVPKSFSPEEKELNVTHLENALKEGFEVKVKFNEKECQKCLSLNGTCGFDNTKQICCMEASSSGCKTFLHIPTDKGLSTGAKAGIAFVGVVFFILIAAAVLLCTARRRKKTKEAQYTSKHLPITSYSSIAATSGMVGKCQRKTSNELEQKYLNTLIPLKHYSYAQVNRITKSFTEMVGKGGFGTVYKGTLCDGRSVAVKILKDSKDNGEDFINEVASISKTSHVNIVSLLDFCSEGSKRAIIYEYMENGSLDQYISRNTSMNIDWMILYRIALGVARGLEYFRHGCKTRIVHFDIKPQNVLLDDNLCPKVSDFGLAKVCEKKESILSLLDTRGTVGYIAPEVFSRIYGRVSYKSDVYSYGMLVLEMIGAREKTSAENSASNPSSMYFPEWIYKEYEKGDKGKLYGNGITCEEEGIVKKMKLVGLWCIQPSPSDRPPMNRVVEMMEGNLNALEVPPRPVLQIPAAPLLESSTLSEDISVYTEV